MQSGSASRDGGFLICTDDEKQLIVRKDGKSEEFFRRFISGNDFINNKIRWCIWLKNVSPEKFKHIQEFQERFKSVRAFREDSARSGTKKMANLPYLFAEERQPEDDFLLIPKVSSENRTYIPIAYLSKDYIITDKTLNWLKTERTEEEPFLLMYLHKAPHREWLPPERHYKTFTKKTFPEPETLFDNYEGRGSAAKEAEMNLLTHMNWAGDSKIRPEVMDELGIPETAKWDKGAYKREVGRQNEAQRAKWDAVYDPIIADFEKNYPSMDDKQLMEYKYQRYMQDYLGTIASVDDNVGRVLDYLDEEKLADNTIVIYTSDQGFYLGEHGWFDKRFMYNESFKTPLLIKWPNKITAGTTEDEMVQNLDFAQTFLEIAGVEAPKDMQGESLVPLLAGKKEAWDRDAVYYHYYEYPGEHAVKRHYGIATKEYKLIHFYHDVNEWELYDSKKDPNEVNNVYNDPNYAEVAKEMTQKLKDVRKKYKDSETLDNHYIELYNKKK